MPDHEDILSFRRPSDAHEAAANAKSSASPVASRTKPTSRHDEAAQPTVLALARPQGPQPFTWHDLRDEQPSSPVRIYLGRTCLSSSGDALPSAGSVIRLDRKVEDPVEIVVGGEVVALGRLIVAQNKVAVEICQVFRARRQRMA